MEMKNKTVEINKERLIEMMTENWAIDNNDVCKEETLKFLEEIGFTNEEVEYYFFDLIRED